MDSVRKIINCTPEQYMTLLKEGQVEIDGVIKTKEDDVLYNTGELSLLEWYNKVMSAELDRYSIPHTPMTAKTLEQEYEDIVASDEQYGFVSAVGYRAMLKSGDTVKVSGNAGDFFLNGERLTKDYTYSGEGVELVSVWVFETVSQMIIAPPYLNDTPTFSPYEIIVKNKNQTPTINENYYLYAVNIVTDGYRFSVNPLSCKTMVSNGESDFLQLLSSALYVLTSDCNKITGFTLSSRSKLKYLNFPECREININGAGLSDLKSATDWTFGKLGRIVNQGGSSILFNNTHTVYIPSTVREVVGRLCSGNTNIRLECNNAVSISSNWCVAAPTNFSMSKNWNVSVNIAVAAKNWGKDKFIDLFENYLVDLSVMGDDGTFLTEKEITIPKAIYDILTEEEFAIAENKNWIVGGA